MQTKSILAGAVLALATAVSANNVATITANPSQQSQIEADGSSFFSSLYAQPAFTSVLEVLATGLPEEIIYSITADPSDFFVMLATETALPDYLSAVPSDVQSYLKSVGAAEASIINKDTGNDAKGLDVKVKAVAAGLAAGVVGVLML